MSNGNGQNGNGQGTNPAAYEYDVFLSYSYRADQTEWVRDKFEPNFQYPLDDELTQLGLVTPPPKGRICVAKREITAGDIWPNELQEELQRSKVLVAICSPKYFTSAWCLSEWKTFQQRAPELIVPVLYYGSDDYLYQRIQPIQGEDFRDFRDIPGARKHLFTARLEKLAHVVAKKVLDAPSFNGGFPSVISGAATPNVQFLSL